MNLTQKRFSEYKEYVCKKMNIGEELYDLVAIDVEQYFGFYNPFVKYAGAGDSSDKNEHWTSKIVPEPYDNFIYYVHDGIYSLIENGHKNPFTICYQYNMPGFGNWKAFADKMMFTMMRKHGLLAYIYYRAVRLFGRV